MDRLTWGKGYEVASEDIQELQTNIEDSQELQSQFSNVQGILEDLTLPANQREGATNEHSPTPNMTVDILAFNAMNDNGDVIRVRDDINVNITNDDGGNSTAVVTSGNERWISLFVEHDRENLDRRIDDDGNEYFKNNRDSYKIRIKTSAEFLDSLSQSSKDLLRPTKTEDDWLYVSDILAYFGMTEVVDADIFSERKQGLAQSNANLVYFDNALSLYSPGTDNVDEALNEVMSYITGTAVPTKLEEVRRRYHSVGANDIRFYFDKDNNRVYTMKAEKYQMKKVDQYWNGTLTGVVAQAEITPSVTKIVFRTHDRNTDTYSSELILDTGIVYSPKVLWDGTRWGVFWLKENSGDLEIKYAKVDNTSTPTVVSSLSNINNYLTTPVFDSHIARYAVSYNSSSSKYLVVWQDDANRIQYRGFDIATLTMSAVTQLDTVAATCQTPVVSASGTNWAIWWNNQTANSIAVRGVDSSYVAYPVAETQVAHSGGFSVGSLHCVSTSGTNVMSVLLDSSGDAKVYKSVSTTLTSITSVGTFDGGATVRAIHGIVWNTAISNIAVFFSDNGVGRLAYREMSEASTAGANTQITSVSDALYDTTFGYISKPQYEPGGNENYRFIILEPSLSFPFNLREMAYIIKIDQGSGTEVYSLFRQGNGGNFGIVLGYNPKSAVKAKVGEFDGDYVTVLDDQIVKIDISTSLYTGVTVQNVEQLITAGDIVNRSGVPEYVYDYFRVKLISRMDDIFGDSVLIGDSSDAARADIEYFPNGVPLITGTEGIIDFDPATGQITLDRVPKQNIETDPVADPTGALTAEDLTLHELVSIDTYSLFNTEYESRTIAQAIGELWDKLLLGSKVDISGGLTGSYLVQLKHTTATLSSKTATRLNFTTAGSGFYKGDLVVQTVTGAFGWVLDTNNTSYVDIVSTDRFTTTDPVYVYGHRLTVTVPRIYDAIVDRDDYASDSLAGTALKTVIESGLYSSIFVRNGNYDIGNMSGGTGIAVPAIVNLITGESVLGVKIQSTASAGGTLFSTPFDGSFTDFTLEFKSGSINSGLTGVLIAATAQTTYQRVYIKFSQNPTGSNEGFNGGSSEYATLSDCLVTGIIKGTAYLNLYGASAKITAEFGRVCINCRNVNSVTIVSNPSIASIDTVYLFESCINISNVYIHNQTGTWSALIDLRLFYLCEQVANVRWAQSSAISYPLTVSNGWFTSADDVTNVRINTGAITFTATSSAGFMFNGCSRVSGIQIVTGAINFGTSPSVLSFVANCKMMDSTRINTGNISGTYTQLYGFTGCNYVDNSAWVTGTVTPGTIVTTQLKIIGGQNCDQLNRVHVQFSPTSNAGSGFNTCDGLTQCLVSGNGNIDRGISDSNRVSSCHVISVTTSYQSCTGIGNTYNGGAAPISVTALSGFAATSTEATPSI